MHFVLSHHLECWDYYKRSTLSHRIVKSLQCHTTLYMNVYFYQYTNTISDSASTCVWYHAGTCPKIGTSSSPAASSTFYATAAATSTTSSESPSSYGGTGMYEAPPAESHPYYPVSDSYNTPEYSPPSVSAGSNTAATVANVPVVGPDGHPTTPSDAFVQSQAPDLNNPNDAVYTPSYDASSVG